MLFIVFVFFPLWDHLHRWKSSVNIAITKQYNNIINKMKSIFVYFFFSYSIFLLFFLVSSRQLLFIFLLLQWNCCLSRDIIYNAWDLHLKIRWTTEYRTKLMLSASRNYFLFSLMPFSFVAENTDSPKMYHVDCLS